MPSYMRNVNNHTIFFIWKDTIIVRCFQKNKISLHKTNLLEARPTRQYWQVGLA